MNNDAVNSTSERIISIIIEHQSRSKRGCVQVALRNAGGCKGTRMKLELHILYEEGAYHEVVSDCLSLDEISDIHEAIARYCKQSNGKLDYFRF